MKIIILLVIMYGRGERSIAEQLGCEIDEAKNIKENVYEAFPRIKAFERESQLKVKQFGYVNTLWGRKRHLPEYNLPNYTFKYLDENDNPVDTPEVPDSIKSDLTAKVSNMYWKKKDEYIDKIKQTQRILIIDNNSKIAAAGRQIINSQVQGCLDGSTKVKSKEYGEINLQDHVNETLNLWDGEDWTPGTIVESGKKQKCIIYLDDGSQFICSPDHKFRVTTKDGSKVWKKCSELSEDDNIDEDNLNESSM